MPGLTRDLFDRIRDRYTPVEPPEFGPIGGNTSYQSPRNPYDPVSYASPISYNDKEDGSDINARLIRAEYDDYRNRFLPLETELMRLALDPVEKQKAIDRSGLDVERGFASAAQQSSMSAQRFGIRDPSTQTGAIRNRDISRTAAIANAKNQTRRAQDDLTMSIMTGSTNNGSNNRLGGG